MRLIIFSQPSVFFRADLRAHSFGFILTSPGLVRLLLFGSNPPCTRKSNFTVFVGISGAVWAAVWGTVVRNIRHRQAYKNSGLERAIRARPLFPGGAVKATEK